MREEGIELSQRERERLKVLHEVPQGHWRQREAAGRLQWSRRQVRRLRRRVRKQGDRGLIHRLRGRPSNRKIVASRQRRILAEERRLDGSLWARFRHRYLSLPPCPAAPLWAATPSGLRPPGLAAQTRRKTKYVPPPTHPWKRTLLLGRKADIPTLR